LTAVSIEILLDASGTSDMTVAGRDVGHLHGTAWISGPGNMALAGHVDLPDGTPGVFADLEDLAEGDEITLVLPDGTQRRYRVESAEVVSSNDLTPLDPTAEDRLTLITCHSFVPDRSTYQERLILSAARAL
jgi:LPXTG-site transpeptidase (sortase) family protein